MKKLLCLLTLIQMTGPAKFPGMIIRFSDGKPRWECEFGIKTATATVKDNLILESVGCEEKTQVFSGYTINDFQPTFKQTW